MLKAHFQPKPLVIAERFHFHRRDQAVGESIADYVAQLRHLSAHCEFGEYLNDALRDRLVCGMRSESAQKRLLSESDLTFKRALELSQGMEAAERNAKALKGTEAAVKKVSPSQYAKNSAPTTRVPCYRCGRSNHDASKCHFAEATCHNCGEKGHIAPACRAKKSSGRKSGPRKDPKAQYVATAPEDSTTDDFQLHTVSAKPSRPMIVDLLVNGKQFAMEVDTGAAVSIISEATYKSLFTDSKLQKCDVVLRTYTDERMTVLGQFPVQVTHGQQRKQLCLIVVSGDGPSLLGRDWLRHIRLDWKKIGAVSEEVSLGTLLDKHQALFKEGLGKIHPYKAKLQVRPDAQPKFFKPRSVPFAIKPAIEQELDRLEASGAMVKVTHSDWAAPIVPVPKKDGKFRICGDYKVTINQALDVDQYPLPKPDDLFATLASGKKFTLKLDLSQAYQQLELDEDSSQYVTVNTHQGLYRFTRLPFGVASAPALFQQLMDTMLQGIPHVICYIDDILVTGVNDSEHLSSLAAVLERLERHGFRMKLEREMRIPTTSSRVSWAQN